MFSLRFVEEIYLIWLKIMASDRIDSLIISRRASGVITPNRILKLDSSNFTVLQAASPKDTLAGVAYFTGRTFRRYQYNPQNDFVPSSTPGDVSVRGDAPPDAIAGDMIDMVCGGIASVEYGGNITVGQWVTSDLLGRAVSAYYGASVVGFATTNGSLGTLGSILVLPITSYTNTAIPSTLVDAATVAIDSAVANEFNVTLTGNRTLGVPSNPVNGARMTLFIRQDATGSRTLTLPTGAGGFALGDFANTTLSTAANATDIIAATYSSVVGKWLITNFRKGYV